MDPYKRSKIPEIIKTRPDFPMPQQSTNQKKALKKDQTKGDMKLKKSQRDAGGSLLTLQRSYTKSLRARGNNTSPRRKVKML